MRQTDTQLAARAQNGDQLAAEALIRRHERLVRTIAAGFYWDGADRDDVTQEALIGLYSAVMRFQPDRQVPFRKYAMMSIRAQLITAVKAAHRLKHQPLSRSARRAFDEDGQPIEVIDLIPDPSPTAQELAESRETIARLIRARRMLTDLERDSLDIAANGREYVGRKNVDNAIQRARVKLRAAA